MGFVSNETFDFLSMEAKFLSKSMNIVLQPTPQISLDLD